MSRDDSRSRVSLLMKTWNDTEAEMVRQILSSQAIPCQVVSDVPHTVWPIAVDGLGEVRILVPTSRLAEARDLLAEHRRRGFRVVEGQGGDPGETESEEASPDAPRRIEGEES